MPQGIAVRAITALLGERDPLPGAFVELAAIAELLPGGEKEVSRSSTHPITGSPAGAIGCSR
ncbi:hypothetical protein ACIBQX_03155 [Nonomuraea sp. NPDC049714]|uniref:hypothetical protein n=1 Tax=Nonomuraea sp. NPDC049714 TaxID=3364357 RepID=UPI00378D278E